VKNFRRTLLTWTSALRSTSLADPTCVTASRSALAITFPGRRQSASSKSNSAAESGLVDTISTDFAGGDWNDILSAIHRIIIKRQMAPAAAVALATGNVARIFPEMAADRGLLARGKRADLAICESHDLSKVRHVICAGKAVVFNAAIASRRRASTQQGQSPRSPECRD
jgi:hypothetical protein